VTDVVDAFFGVLEPPRLESAAAVRKAVVRGVAESVFGYTSGATPSLGPDDRYQVSPDKVAFGETLAEDEVDFDSGFLILPAAIPVPEPPPGVPRAVAPGLGDEVVPPGPTPPGPTVPGPTPPAGPGPAPRKTALRLRFAANRSQIFQSFPAIANLADKSDGGRVIIEINANASAGYDPAWLRNAVQEPLDEANIETEEL
jgi:hypothetical protein